MKTECLLTCDGAGRHAAFRAHDPDPAAIRAHLSDRDQAGRHFHLQIDDTIERLNAGGGRLYRPSLAQMRLMYQFRVRTFVRAIVQPTDIRRDVSLYDPLLNPDGVAAREGGKPLLS